MDPTQDVNAPQRDANAPTQSPPTDPLAQQASNAPPPGDAQPASLNAGGPVTNEALPATDVQFTRDPTPGSPMILEPQATQAEPPEIEPELQAKLDALKQEYAAARAMEQAKAQLGARGQPAGHPDPDAVLKGQQAQIQAAQGAPLIDNSSPLVEAAEVAAGPAVTADTEAVMTDAERAWHDLQTFINDGRARIELALSPVQHLAPAGAPQMGQVLFTSLSTAFHELMQHVALLHPANPVINHGSAITEPDPD